MKKVIVIEEFKDSLADVDRRVADVFEVSDERYAVLMGRNDYQRAFVKDFDGGQDWSKFGKAELQAVLTDKGIAFDKKANKEELIALLTAKNTEE